MSLSNYIQAEQTACLKKYGVFFAFSAKQFNDQCQKNVLYTDLGAGTICPKDKAKEFLKAHAAIIEAGIAKDIAENGKESIIRRELANHECYYTGEIEQCVDALEDYGFSYDDILNVFRLGEGA